MPAGGHHVAHVGPHLVLVARVGVHDVPAPRTVVRALDGDDLLVIAAPAQPLVPGRASVVVGGGVEHQVGLARRGQALRRVVDSHRYILRIGVVGHVGGPGYLLKRSVISFPKPRLSTKMRLIMMMQGGHDDRGVVDQLRTRGPGHLAHLVPDLTGELHRGGPLAARRTPPRSAGPVPAAPGDLPAGTRAARGGRQATHRPPSALGAASCASFRGSRVMPHIDFRWLRLVGLGAGQEGLEPSTAGFGDRCSSN